MTEQEIEKIRKNLGSDYSVKRRNGAITVELVDIWNGVEFAECVEYYKGSKIETEIFQGQIYKITAWFKREFIYFERFEYGWPVLFFKPSTEAAYVDQLKAKAHELYEEIKDGDRFECITGNVARIHINNPSWCYFKDSDSFHYEGFLIYQQGKWAKKIQQAIVTPVEIHSEEPDIVGDQVISIQMKIIHGHISQKNRKDVAYHLAKCLEDYLNKS